MKVLSVVGSRGSGKTYLVNGLIAGLIARGYSVGTIKEYFASQPDFFCDLHDLQSHKEMGSQTLAARNFFSTNIFYPQNMGMEELLGFFRNDFVILEGVRDMKIPMILTAHDLEEFDRWKNCRVFAASGIFANGAGPDEKIMGEDEMIPLIDSQKQITLLLDLVTEKVNDWDGPGIELYTADGKLDLSNDVWRKCLLQFALSGLDLPQDGVLVKKNE